MTSAAGNRAALYLPLGPGAESARSALVRHAKEHGHEVVAVYEEPQGAPKAKPVLAQAVLAAHAGKFDALIVPALAVLGQSSTEALSTAGRLASLVAVHALSEPWVAEGCALLPRLSEWLTAQAAAARSARSREATAKARRRGRKPGRPRKSVDVEEARKYLATMTTAQAARALGVGESTLRRALADAEESRPVVLPPMQSVSTSIDEALQKVVAA